jgi:hypothetical protein
VVLSDLSASTIDSLPTKIKMRFFATLFSLMAFVVTCSLAFDLKIPEGYWITEIHPISKEHQGQSSEDNPNVPLLNATMDCWKQYASLWYGYELNGFGWEGYGEKKIKATANQGPARMSKWRYWHWEKQLCGTHLNNLTDYCVNVGPAWKATVSVLNLSTSGRWSPRACAKANGDELQFRMTMVAGHESEMMDRFAFLTGAPGVSLRNTTSWTTTNGTHELEGDMFKAYPPYGFNNVFRCFR